MEKYIKEFTEKAENTLTFLENSLVKLRATGASPNMVSEIKTMYHEEKISIKNIASIRVQDALSLIVLPFEQDKKISKSIATAINAENLGLTATDEGKQVRVSIPPVTSEKRQEYVKQAKDDAEEARISIRNIRHALNKEIDANEEHSDDEKRKYKNEIQDLVNTYNNKIQEKFVIKEKELITV